MQLTNAQYIESQELQLSKLRKEIDQANEVDKLVRSPLFKKVILDYFCVQECATFAQLSADPSLSPEARADCLGLAQAAGHLRRWLTTIERKAKVAKDTIPQLEESLEQLRADPDGESESVEMH